MTENSNGTRWRPIEWEKATERAIARAKAEEREEIVNEARRRRADAYGDVTRRELDSFVMWLERRAQGDHDATS